jgi:hypothetical protein
VTSPLLALADSCTLDLTLRRGRLIPCGLAEIPLDYLPVA